MKFSKADKKMMEQLFGAMHLIYKKKSKLKGGNFGDFVLDVLHGLSLPFTGPVGQKIISSSLGEETGNKINGITTALDKSITGQGQKGSGLFTSVGARTFLNTVLPVVGEGIYQVAKATGGCGDCTKKGRGRPKKVKVELIPIKKKVGRPRKAHV